MCAHTIRTHWMLLCYLLLHFTLNSFCSCSFHFPLFAPLFPLTHFSQPACVSYLHSYFLYTLFVERSFIWNSGAHSDFLSLSATLIPTLPFSLALTQRQISLPDCLPPHRTAPHLHHSSAHILYAAIHKHVIRTHTRIKAALVLFLVGKKKNTK